MRARFVRGSPLVLLLAASLSAATLVETTVEDFRDGAFDDNIYASTRGGGAVELTWRLDLNGDGFIDLICPDDTIGFLRVYFGSSAGFDTAAARLYPTPGGGGVDVADLDCGGWADLVHSGWHSRRVTVYRGTSSGPSETDTFQLEVLDKSEAVSVADLDQDGWLDIVVGVRMSMLQVFWGSSTGYSNSNRTDVPAFGKLGHNLDIADLDRDGWLDIVAAAWDQRANPVVYWGPGRAPRDVKYLPVTELNPHGIATADLNSDGWLDLVFPGYDTVAPTYIYYGSDSGFSALRREEIIPGLCYGGVTAFDWDSDSDLDLIFFRGEFRRDTAQALSVYFNDPFRTPQFLDDDTIELAAPGFNTSGGMIADFNQDGAPDVFVQVYADSAPSLVFWGPDHQVRDTLPSVRSHHGQAREPGNSYDRGFHETYVSSVLGDTWPSQWHRVAWDDSTPAGAATAFSFRFGNTTVPDSTWSGWLPAASEDTIPDSLDSRYLQYRCRFTFDNPAQLPLLYEVRIEFDPAPWRDVGAIAILAPTGALDSGTVVTPAVVVHNFGNRAEAFPVTMRIGADYAATVAETLGAGESDTVRFPDWRAQPVDTLDVVGFTALDPDTNRQNDTARTFVVVLRPPYPDVGATVILGPAGRVDSGSVHIPRAVVTNFGPLPAVFPVVMRIGADYEETVGETLGVGETDTVAFPAWAADVPGLFDIVGWTDLEGDGDRTNDTVADTVRVLNQPVPDVAAIAILAPGLSADSGQVIAPAAVVRNYGAFDAIFPVTMEIGAGYSERLTETLAAGRGDTLTFPAWVAGPIGTLAVRCYTALENDPRPENDTVESRVIVGPPDVHDVGATAILSPTGTHLAGESLFPRARITNFGRKPERYFDVRMRIGSSYNRAVNVGLVLEPAAVMDVAFPVWVAEPGEFSVSCSTELTQDMDPLNDKVTAELAVSRLLRLWIEEDQTATITTGESRDFRFSALFSGDSAACVDLAPIPEPGGWVVELRDTAGQELSGTLGLVRQGEAKGFVLHVGAPAENLGGTRESLGLRTFVLRGFLREAPAVSDSALLSLRLSAALEIHNYPNPMGRKTRFVFGLPEDGTVTLVIYNRAGEVVKRLLESKREHGGIRFADWDGDNDRGRRVASGTYRYVFTFEHGGRSERIVKKLAVVRD